MNARPLVISTGCPAGIGPEISVDAAAQCAAVGTPCVLIGDETTLAMAAELRSIPRALLRPYTGARRLPPGVYVHNPARPLPEDARDPGRPTPASGAAQLAYVAEGVRLVKHNGAAGLVTAPVSKAVVANSGARGSKSFRGHTEWLERRDGAPYSVMCFAGPRLVTSLATTHIPVRRVPQGVTRAAVRRAASELARLLRLLGTKRPTVAIASLNPHAGEDGLLGGEERRALVPGRDDARAMWRRRARFVGPIGAETAFRKAAGGEFAGVVAMYHDQATIPTKLIGFGDTVNVTMGHQRRSWDRLRYRVERCCR